MQAHPPHAASLLRRRRPPARPLKYALLAGFCTLILLYACSDFTDVAAPGAKPHSARVGFAPSYAFLGNASYVGDPINRIRLTARNQSTGEVVGSLVTDVDPNAQDWNLALDITLNSQIEIVVTIELINVVGGVESVQWSGRTNPISVAPAQPTQTTTPVTLYQGPPANLTVTGVVIAPDSAALTEGSTTQFTASITGGNGAHAVWS